MNSKQTRRTMILALIILAVLSSVIYYSRGTARQVARMSLGTLAAEMRRGDVNQITVSGNDVTVELKSGEFVTVYKEDGPLTEQLRALGVTEAQLGDIEYTVFRPTGAETGIKLVGFMLPALLVAGIIWLMLWWARRATRQAGTAEPTLSDDWRRKV